MDDVPTIYGHDGMSAARFLLTSMLLHGRRMKKPMCRVCKPLSLGKPLCADCLAPGCMPPPR
jgi:hypothetical protein